MTGNAGTLGGGLLALWLLEVRGGLYQDNVAQDAGGAIYALFGAATISGAEISANHAVRGGGIYGSSDDLHVLNTLLAGNTATSGQGHGLFADDPERVTIVHTTLATPSVTAGSAIYLSNTVAAAITNTLIANFGTGIEALTGTVTQDYNLFAGVTTPAIGAAGGAHDVFGAPDFLAPLAGDYHLGPASRAIDRGAAGTGVGVDFDGEARPFGPLPDIGYDERTAGYKLYLPAVRRD
jgi:hypothetical protein